jgi:ribosome biogenesis protein SSF1/2
MCAGTEYLSPPLVVLNNMQSDERHLKLTDVMIQNLFPAIDVDTVKLQQCRRVVLFRRDPETGDFDLRHYVVNVKAAGLSKGVRKILRRPKLPDLSKYKDISDYVIGGGGASDSEADDIEESRVEIQPGHKAIDGNHGTRPSKEAEEAAVKLTEVGPRMRLKLLKIEDGFCQGEVLYHSHVGKDPEEVAARRAEMNKRKAEKEARKLQQRENVQKKKYPRVSSTGSDADDSDTNEGHPMDSVKQGDGLWSDDDDDVAYYKDQVGEEPEAGTFRHAKKAKFDPKKGGVKDRGPKGGVKGGGKEKTIAEQIAHRKMLKTKREKQKAKKRIKSKGKGKK